jgi:hypothetical protein
MKAFVRTAREEGREGGREGRRRRGMPLKFYMYEREGGRE